MAPSSTFSRTWLSETPAPSRKRRSYLHKVTYTSMRPEAPPTLKRSLRKSGAAGTFWQDAHRRGQWWSRVVVLRDGLLTSYLTSLRSRASAISIFPHDPSAKVRSWNLRLLIGSAPGSWRLSRVGRSVCAEKDSSVKISQTGTCGNRQAWVSTYRASLCGWTSYFLPALSL